MGALMGSFLAMLVVSHRLTKLQLSSIIDISHLLKNSYFFVYRAGFYLSLSLLSEYLEG